jgi:hypothetical protein
MDVEPERPVFLGRLVAVCPVIDGRWSIYPQLIFESAGRSTYVCGSGPLQSDLRQRGGYQSELFNPERMWT